MLFFCVVSYINEEIPGYSPCKKALLPFILLIPSDKESPAGYSPY
jgi:hypothetical protein